MLLKFYFLFFDMLFFFAHQRSLVVDLWTTLKAVKIGTWRERRQNKHNNNKKREGARKRGFVAKCCCCLLVVLGGGGDDDDDVVGRLFFFDVHLSVTCECKSCSKGGACFCFCFVFCFFFLYHQEHCLSKLGRRVRNGVCLCTRVWVATIAMSSPKTARLHFSVGETKAAFGNEEDEEVGKAHGNV